MKWKLSMPKRLNRSFSVDMALLVLLAGVGTFMALPLVYIVSNAFKPLDEIFLFPPRFFVRNPTLDNFSDLFNIFEDSWVPFTRYMFNTFFIAIVGTAGHVLIASAAAYPLAKYKFLGKNVLFSMVVFSLMFSPHVTAIPNYMTKSWLGMIDTYWAIIIPAFGYTLGLYLMKQFMEQIPDALIEAAKIDGASEYRIFWQIVMPIVRPAWLTLIIFSFQQLWTVGATALHIQRRVENDGLRIQSNLAGRYCAYGCCGCGIIADDGCADHGIHCHTKQCNTNNVYIRHERLERGGNH
jgi:ABC-type glycerol-3-phosphate transport system permease component